MNVKTSIGFTWLFMTMTGNAVEFTAPNMTGLQKSLAQLTHVNAAERRAALLTLTTLNDVRAIPFVIPALRSALKDPDPSVQEAARQALEQLGELDTDTLKRRAP